MADAPVTEAGIASRLQAAARLLQEGRAEEAAAACAEILDRDAAHPLALHLQGLALSRLGRTQDASAVLRRAVAAAPERPASHVALGNALRKGGDNAGARAAFDAALGLDPGNAAAAFNLALAEADLGNDARADALLHRVARADPLDFDATQLLVQRVASRTEKLASGPGEAPAQGPCVELGRVSVGFCSIDAAREARARASLAAALGATPHEIIVIRDARSLSEALNRILDQARGDTVVLCHDDIEVISPRLDHALERALREADIVGVAGSQRVSGPAVLWSGHPHLHGWVTYPRGGALEAAPLSLRSGVIGGMQALDGVFLAMRGTVARTLRFDDSTFDGFHFYDLDFTYRAHLAGHRLAVTTEALLLHASEGRFDAEWNRYAERFRAKFPALAEPSRPAHWYGARVASAAHAVRFYEALTTLDAARDSP